MKTYPKVSIIVLNYNGQDCLENCLESLSQVVYPNTEVIIVDNGSTDNSAFLAQKKYPHFCFLFNTNNEGFAKGMNKGIRKAFSAGSNFFVLFNYDATIEASSVEQVIHQMVKDPQIGLASPLIYDTYGKNMWFGKGKINFWLMRVEHTTPSTHELGQGAYQSEFLTGCVLFIARSTVEKIGFLDENFFLYYEDADYSLRTKKAGLLCVVVPSGKVYHTEKSNQKSTKVYFLVLSGLIFFQKYAPLWLKPYHKMYVTMRRGKNLIERYLFPTTASLEVFRAYNDFFYDKRS